MDTRQLIRRKLADGRLPLTGVFRAEVGPKQAAPCDACDREVSADEMLVAVTGSNDGRLIRLHAECFKLWRVEVEAAA